MNKASNKKNIKYPDAVRILPQISDYSSRSGWEKDCWQEILKSKELLEILVSSYERHNLVLRAAAIESISSGKSYREIGKKLWLSSQTISSIKKAMSGKGYRSYFERGKKERRKKEYSVNRVSHKSRPEGKPHRTKYGTVYLPL